MRNSQQFRLLCAVCLLWQLAGGLAAAADPRPEVSLVVDYGDGVQLRFTALAWRQGMTALDALTAAGKHPRGVKFVQRGRGASAIVTEIDGLKNDAGGNNWLFSVNGKTAEVGSGALELKAGDVVLWEYKPYE